MKVGWQFVLLDDGAPTVRSRSASGDLPEDCWTIRGKGVGRNGRGGQRSLTGTRSKLILCCWQQRHSQGGQRRCKFDTTFNGRG